MINFKRFLYDTPSSLRNRLIVWSVPAAGLMLTLAVALLMKASADRLEERDFVAECSELQKDIANRLDDHARILLSGAALFHASGAVTREQWRIFTSCLKVEEHLPGIQGLGFSLLIPRAELSLHTQGIRREGFPDYQVRPAGERELYSSIIYLEPFSGRNLRAFGYDMFSELVRRTAMERARDTDAPALSGKVVLVQETGQEVQAGTLMYVPVYRKGLPTETIEQRRAALIGWVYSPYRMTDLLQGILGASGLAQKAQRHLAIYDGERPSPQSLLFGRIPEEHGDRGCCMRFKRQIPVEFNGHRWTLCFAQTGSGLLTTEFAIVWLTLGGGALVTLLLCALIRVLLSTRSKAQQLAEAMTLDLQKSEESLRQVTERLSLAARAGGVGIWDYDVVNNQLVWDEQMFRLYGITKEQFGGAYEAWQAGLHPEDRQRGDEEIKLALLGKKEFDIDFRVLWPDGTTHYICGFASVQREASGQPLRMIGTNWDITASRLAEDDIKRQAALINSLLDSIPDIIFFKDVQGVYLGCNPAFAEFVGRSRETIIGKTDYALFDRKTADFFKKNDRLMLDLCEARHNEEWITYPDGRKRQIDTLKTPYWGPNKKLMGILGISRDITERRQSEDALRKSEEQVSLLLNSTAEAIYGIDLQGDCIFANPACVRMLGYACMEQLLGKNMHELIHHSYPDGRPMPVDVCKIYQAFREGKDVHVDDEVLWKADGTSFPVEYWSYPVSVKGSVTGSVVTFVDITKRLQAEESLRESEANFRTFFETMTDMIMVGTPEGQILFANDAVTRTLGYAPDELKVMHLLDVHPADRRQEAQVIFAAMFRGERESCPLPLARKDGGLVPVETRVWFGRWNGENCLFGICKNLSAEQESKQRFERLFRCNPSLMALSSLPDRRIVDVNDAFLKALGYSREEVIGNTSADLALFVHPERQAALADRILAEGRVGDFELQLRRKDGVVLDGLYSGEPISSQGERYLLSVMTDITARKRTEAELARLSVIQNELMLLATEFINVPLERQDAAIDQSLETMGRLIHADRAYLFEYDFGAGVMNNTHEWCNDGITPEIGNLQAVPNAMLPDWVEAHRRNTCVHIPSLAALPADGYLWQVLAPQGIRSLITLPLMQGAACLGFVGFDAVAEERSWREEDIALLRVLAELYSHFEARRAAERETLELQKRLTQARDEAQKAAFSKSLFLANMSHEIRTPLNAILGYAQIMERECRPCQVKPRLKAITRSGEHLLQLLTDLLELVRSDTHQVILAPGAFDLYQALEDVRLMFVRRPAAQAVPIELTCAPDVPQFLFADSGKVRQVLVNLVGNAVKFTDKGNVRLTASVLPGESPDDRLIAVDIEDTGSGIGRGEMELIFDVFEQAESGRKSGKGTGLGLPLSRRYARALGGDVTVASRAGEGSRFRFTFRGTRVDGMAVERLHDDVVLRLAPGQNVCRLLVVDDDSASREMLADLLEPVGFAVETAADGAQALHRLGQSTAFDLVLMDKRMPEMNGYEAIARLRQLPRGGELKVLVVSASGFADERAPALAAGADGYVSKPVRREQLLKEIGRVSGVRYEYEPKITGGAASQNPVILDASAMLRLTEEQCNLFDQALRRGDIRVMREMIEVIARDQNELAASLRVLVDAYDYDRLRGMFASLKEKTK
jgi:PAS domain S-box-containing protein